jgi:ubiquinone/menaquinone biosynthesis C-methylase UbiE
VKPASDRAADLLSSPSPPVPREGFLDVLGEDGVPPTISQRWMQSRLLPGIYERLWRPVGLALLSAGYDIDKEQGLMQELLRLESGQTVLDVACGPGNTTRRMLAEVGERGLAVGLDASASMLARAVADTSHPAAAYVRADAVALPFRDGVFDAVSCFAALYLIDDPFGALREMHRVLAPGGRLALLTSCKRGPALLSGVVGALGATTGVRAFGREEMVSRLDGLGFESIEQHVAGFAQFLGACKPAAA